MSTDWFISVADPLTENTGSFKVDYNMTSNDRLNFRYNANKNLTQTYFGVAQGQLQTARGFLQLAKLAETHTFSPRLILESAFAFNRAHIDPRAAETEDVLNFPITALGSGSAGVGPGLFDLKVANNSFSLLETASFISGRQQIRFGEPGGVALSGRRTCVTRALSDSPRAPRSQSPVSCWAWRYAVRPQ